MMLRVLLSLIIIILSAGRSYSSGFEDPALIKLLETAVRHNPAIAAAAERVNRLRAEKREAAAELGPSLIGRLSARRDKDEPSYGSFAASRRDTYSSTLAFIQTIYAGGSLTAKKRAAEFALAGETEAALRTCQHVMKSVRVSYHEVQRAFALLRVREEALALSREHLRETEALFRGGIVPMGDVLRIQVAVSQEELNQLRAKNALDVSHIALERATGVPVSRDEILAPLSREHVPELLGLTPPGYTPPNNPAKGAYAFRPELRMYEYYRRRASELIRVASGAFLPRVELTMSAGTEDSRFFPAENENWHVSLNMEWSLYDSGRTAARVSNAASSARELLHRIDDLRAEIESEVARAEKNLSSAALRMNTAEQQAKKAEEDYRRTIRRYEARMSSNLDVLDSRMALTDSRAEYVNAVYDIAVAQADLIYAVGRDAPPK